MASQAPSVSTISIEGHEVIELREPATGSLVQVVPALGSNVIRFRATVAGTAVEVIGTPPDLATLEELPTRWGAGVLFPYPGRVSGDGFEFRGRRVELQPDPATGNAMHGVARRRAWRVLDHGGTVEDGAWVTTALSTVDESIPRAEWPFPFALTMRIGLRSGRLRTEVSVANTGDDAMPFGLGFHPYFPTPLGPRGTADGCEIEIQATERWDGIVEPPATVTALEADEWPLRARPLSAIEVTRVTDTGVTRNYSYFRREEAGGRPLGVEARMIDRANDVQVLLRGSPEFRALVFYTPPGIATASLEPHTSMPNAFNLGGAATPDPGLTVVEAGGTWRGWYEISAMSAQAS